MSLELEWLYLIESKTSHKRFNFPYGTMKVWKTLLHIQDGPKVSSCFFKQTINFINFKSNSNSNIIYFVICKRKNLKNYKFILVGSDFWLTMYFETALSNLVLLTVSRFFSRRQTYCSWQTDQTSIVAQVLIIANNCVSKLLDKATQITMKCKIC